MHIQKLSIDNIKSIRHFEMQFASGKEAGWHVLIGDNGSGKTTILRAIASVMMGDTKLNIDTAQALFDNIHHKNQEPYKVVIEYSKDNIIGTLEVDSVTIDEEGKLEKTREEEENMTFYRGGRHWERSIRQL